MRTMAARALFVALLVGLLIACLAAGPVSARREPVRLIDRDVEDCEENVPVATAANLVDPGGANIDLNVLVLLDGITRPDAEAIVSTAAESYAPLDIKLLATYKRFVAPPDPSAPPSLPTQSASAAMLISDAKKAVGGQRPSATDAVYLLTSRDISVNGDTGGAGYADCIGGIRYPTRAFAVGEGTEEIISFGGLNFYVDGPAKILSHEIGHLLGAHHHYSNCVQGASLGDVAGRDPSPCTVMTENLDLQDLLFGSFEAIVVRGHAESFARP